MFHDNLAGIQWVKMMYVWSVKEGMDFSPFSISSLTGECAAEKIKHFFSMNMFSLHDMVILRSQNKITVF